MGNHYVIELIIALTGLGRVVLALIKLIKSKKK